MNKYKKWYDTLIARAQERGQVANAYCERHHIVPRACGGSDDPDNLGELTYREHFLAHWLLTKICDGDDRLAMIYALHCMSWAQSGRLIAAWQVETAKRAVKDMSLRTLREKFLARRRHKRKIQRRDVDIAIQVEDMPRHHGLTVRRDRDYLRKLTNAYLRAVG